MEWLEGSGQLHGNGRWGDSGRMHRCPHCLTEVSVRQNTQLLPARFEKLVRLTYFSRESAANQKSGSAPTL
jgi:hypothetical protein